jgi:hypothetical protein
VVVAIWCFAGFGTIIQDHSNISFANQVVLLSDLFMNESLYSISALLLQFLRNYYVDSFLTEFDMND